MDNIRKYLKKFLPQSDLFAAISLIFATFIGSVISILYFLTHYKGKQIYKDVITGNITFGQITFGTIYKDVDFNTWYVCFATIILMFLLTNFFLNHVQKAKNQDISKGTENLNSFLLVPIFLIAYFLFQNYSNLFVLIIILMFLIGSKIRHHETLNIYLEKILCSLVFVYLSLCGLIALVSADLASQIIRFLPIIIVFLFLGIYQLIIIYCNWKGKKQTEYFINNLIVILQIFIPFCILGLINITYIYQGQKVNPPYLNLFNNIIWIVTICLIIGHFISSARALKIGKVPSINLTTLISFAIITKWDVFYNLLVNSEQFHTGETAIVWNQIMQFGQKWNVEFISVLQGLGLIVSGINEIIFGGTFASYEQASSVWLMVAVIASVVALYFIVEDKWLIMLYIPLMPLFFMNRTYFIFAVFILLLNPTLIKSPIKWTYLYTFTCVFHVWYQPTYGGVVAASMLIPLVLIWYYALKNKVISIKTKKEKIKYAIFFLSIIGIAIAYIPMLIEAFNFLKSNGEETRIVNGIAAIQTITTVSNPFTGINIIDWVFEFCIKYAAGMFVCVFLFFCLYVYVQKENNQIKKIQGYILTVAGLLSFILILPASFTRIDAGISRIGTMTGVYLCGLVPIFLYIYKDRINLRLLGFVFVITVSATVYFSYQPYFTTHERVRATVIIPDSYIYISPEKTGLDKLGYAFVDNSKYVDEARAIKELCDKLLTKEQTYYDFTDKSIYYLYAERKVPGLYVSSMVAANETLQKQVITELKNKDVPVVYVNDPLSYIGRSQALRSYRIYKYFIAQDYKLIRFMNNNFLIRKDINLSPIKKDMQLPQATELLGSIDIDIAQHGELLQELSIKDNTATHSISVVEDNIKISGEDPYIVFNTNGTFNSSDISILEIELINNTFIGQSAQVFIATDTVGHNETNSIHFLFTGIKTIVPIFYSDALNVNSILRNIRIDFDGFSQDDLIAIKSIRLYTLDDTIEFEQMRAENSDHASLRALDKIFYLSNLDYLPSEWGRNWDEMSQRFQYNEILQDKGLPITLLRGDSITLECSLDSKGKDAEFLHLNLEGVPVNGCKMSVEVQGVNEFGGAFKKVFTFYVDSEDVLVPLSISPELFRANMINTLKITSETEDSEILLNTANFCNLTD